MVLKELTARIRRKLVGPYAPGYPVLKPIDSNRVEILADPVFQASCREVDRLTLLDTPRLANLWSLCRMTNPSGHIIEVGSYKGGGALHLSNSAPDRKVVICDSFQGFAELNAELDHAFGLDQFKETSHNQIDTLFRSRNRPYEIIAGFFPDSCKDRDLEGISFAHLDADTYKSTLESLHFLADKFLDRSLIVLDDYFREADGVNKAVLEFTANNKSWVTFPIFPAQGLMIHKSWFD